MKRMTTMRVMLAVLALLLGATFVSAQNPAAPADALSGKYEGVAKNSKAVETRVTLELVHDQGKVTGRLVTPDGPTDITEGTFAENKLSLKLGQGNTAATLTAQLQGDKLAGDWSAGGQKQAVELKRVVVAAATGDAATLSGDWDGLADTQGQGFPFTLTLKIDGEKVTGESNSSLGQAMISNGSYKGGKLSFTLDSQGGAIYMSASLKDGELIGEFDYSGQAQGRWVAKKKTP
jgi:hypothetical protein